MAVYECRPCHILKPVPRHYTFYFGQFPRCPQCGTYRLRCLAERDHIDHFHRGFLSTIQRLFGANLYHCRYCRIQFYDLRGPLAPEAHGVIPPPPLPKDAIIPAVDPPVAAGQNSAQ